MEYKNKCIDAIFPYSPDSVTIGTQTWMSKNLDIDDGGEGILTYDFTSDPNLSSCGIQYYYTYEAALRLANSLDGWHLPTSTEWNTLIDYVGHDVAGTKLKSTYGWYNNGNGTDDYGFCALPVGRFPDDETPELFVLYYRCYFQVYTDINSYTLRFCAWNQNYITTNAYGETSKKPLCSVRLIKD
jgi:uncharacterized protein (TIGR02145 family)